MSGLPLKLGREKKTSLHTGARRNSPRLFNVASGGFKMLLRPWLQPTYTYTDIPRG